MVEAYEAGPDGQKVGRDPRKMKREEFQELGHRQMSPIEAIRARCLDCCGFSESEVRKCVSAKCPSWPFRMGTSPWKNTRNLSEETKAALRDRLAAARAARHT